jgi:hypothetical protein
VPAVLLLALGAVPALAHGRPGQMPPIQGTVTQAGNGKLQISTASGAVTVALRSTTHVVRVVSGSTADLHPYQEVDLHVVPGTSTVDTIRIEGAVKPPKHHDFEVQPAMTQRDGTARHARGTPGLPPNHVEGQVISANSTSITIRTRWSRATYTISNSVTVTKLITGSLNDLAPGEMVQVFRGRDGSALAITIMSA